MNNHVTLIQKLLMFLAIFARTYLAILLILAKKGVFVLEQPASSLVFRLPCFQELCRTTKVPRLHPLENW